MLQVKIKVEQEMMTERLIKPLFKAGSWQAGINLKKIPLYKNPFWVFNSDLSLCIYTLTAPDKNV